MTLPDYAAGKPTDPKLREQAKEVSWTFLWASLHKGLRRLAHLCLLFCQAQLHPAMLCLQEVKAGGDGGAPGQWTANKSMRMAKKVGSRTVQVCA